MVVMVLGLDVGVCNAGLAGEGGLYWRVGIAVIGLTHLYLHQAI